MQRANSDKPNMGLTNYSGQKIKKQDIFIAKNYLDEDELNILNRLVNQYLEFAELQALQRKPMYMKDWIDKLHAFLTLNEKEILKHLGKVSHTDAEAFALQEFEKYQEKLKASELDELDKQIKKLNPPKKRKGKDE